MDGDICFHCSNLLAWHSNLDTFEYQMAVEPLLIYIPWYTKSDRNQSVDLYFDSLSKAAPIHLGLLFRWLSTKLLLIGFGFCCIMMLAPHAVGLYLGIFFIWMTNTSCHGGFPFTLPFTTLVGSKWMSFKTSASSSLQRTDAADDVSTPFITYDVTLFADNWIAFDVIAIIWHSSS